MVSIGISEFTFGYAFLYEQTRTNWGNLRAALILPSLQQEYDEGWDAHLPLTGVDYYYQFKLSDHLSRRNARFIADGTYTDPYYRISFHRHENNRQHQRLRLHALTHPHTYYVAPEINDIDQFNQIFLEERVTEHSRLFPLADCEDVLDGDQHFITFRENIPDWIQHSEKKPHFRSILGKNLRQEYSASMKDQKPIDDKFARDLFAETADSSWKIIQDESKGQRKRFETQMPLLDYNYSNQSRGNVLKRTSQILSVFFGLTLMIMSNDDQG